MLCRCSYASEHSPSDESCPMSRNDIEHQLRELIPRLRRFAYWLTRDVHEADDLVQSTLERALTKWSMRREEASLKSWLFTILYRYFLAEKRRKARYWGLLNKFRYEEPEYWPSAEDEAATQGMLAAFNHLSQDQRGLLLLIVIEGFSYQEAAAMLNVPIGTVMSRLSRARKAMHHLCQGDVPQVMLRVMK